MGYAFERGGNSSVPAGSELSFRGIPLFGVPVRVLAADGTLAESASIRVVHHRTSSSHSSSTKSWRRDDPWLQLRPGVYELTATIQREGPDEWISEACSLRLNADESADEVVLQLRSRPGIWGRITRERQPLEAARLSVRVLALADSGLDLEALAAAPAKETLYDRDADYEIHDLPPGSYAVGLSLGREGPLLDHAVVDVADRMVRQDFAAPPLDRTHALLVRIRDEEGQPVRGVRFSFRWEVGGSSSGSSPEGVEVHEEGDYLVVPPGGHAEAWEGSWPAEARWTVRVHAPGHGEAVRELAPGQRELDVRLVAPATITVTVAGYVESGIAEDLRLVVRSEDDEFQGYHRGLQIDAAGVATHGPVEPGHFVIELQHDADRSWDDRTLARVELQARPGDNAVTLTVPALYTVRVRVDHPEVSRISLVEDVEDRFSGRVRVEDGVAVFEGIPAGDYFLVAPPFAPQPVSVPTGEVRYDVIEPNAMRVSIEDPDGALARLGFQDGDVIIGVDGTEFSNLRHMQALLTGASGAGHEVLVQRGRRQLRIAFDFAAIVAGDGDGGGDLDPVVR